VDEAKHSGRILDAGAVKALAHPLRFQLLELLVEHGPATASGLGRILGENSGSTSYHLRQLEKHGLIEEASEVGNARDRYWRAAEGGWTLRGFEMLQRADTSEAASALLDEVVRARVERVQRWHREGHLWGEDWVETTIEATGRMRLSRDQLAEMTTELVAVMDRFRHEQQPDDAPDTATIAVHLEAFPTEPPPSDPSPSPCD
jgi:DNA-binding transcriptional ArsR family regulator